MTHRIGLAATLICAIAFPGRSAACTIFKITLNGRTFAGNNEAWNDPNTKVWFLTAEKGKYGRVFFGYRNGYAQGGMNERGLFYDWVAGYKTDWKRDGDKLDYPGNFSERVLEEAGGVEEAVALYEKYFEKFNDNSFSAARTLLVDKSGASAIIGWEDGRLKITRGDGACQVLGWDQEATERRLNEVVAASRSGASGRRGAGAEPADGIAEKNADGSSKRASGVSKDVDRNSKSADTWPKSADGSLKSAGGLSNGADAIIEAVSGVLSACQQTGKYRTFYSNVYDLQGGEVRVYQFQDGIPAVTFNLAQELAKGNHYYDLPKIAEQMKLPPATDGRTLARVAVDPAVFAALAGSYELAPGARMIVSIRDEKLFVQFPGEPACELMAASTTKYFLGFADMQLTFELDAAGQGKMVKFHSWDKDLSGVRVQEASSRPAAGKSGEKP